STCSTVELMLFPSRGDGVVAGLVDRLDERGVVELVAADADELRREVDVDARDAAHALQLRRHARAAVLAAHAGDEEGLLDHRPSFRIRRRGICQAYPLPVSRVKARPRRP